MDVFYGYEAAIGQGPFAMAIGTFDGVHRGHQALLHKALQLGAACGLKPAAFTFHPHPMSLAGSHAVPPLICSLEQRLQLFEQMGLGACIVQSLMPPFSKYDPEHYVAEVLQTLPAKQVIVGRGFTFGRNRSGTISLLQQLAPAAGITVTNVDTVKEAEQPISSSRIRSLVQHGRILQAEQLLGRPYVLQGKVVHGKGRGRHLGFPTANVDVDSLLIPAAGVYAARAETDDGRRFMAAVHVGPPVTFNEQHATVEAFLLDYPGGDELYGHSLCLRFIGQVRPSRRFTSREELVAQMQRDIAAVAGFFADAAQNSC